MFIRSLSIILVMVFSLALFQQDVMAADPSAKLTLKGIIKEVTTIGFDDDGESKNIDFDDLSNFSNSSSAITTLKIASNHYKGQTLSCDGQGQLIDSNSRKAIDYSLSFSEKNSVVDLSDIALNKSNKEFDVQLLTPNDNHLAVEINFIIDINIPDRQLQYAGTYLDEISCSLVALD